MMVAKKEVIEKITLTMNKKEAAWLKGLMQNLLNNQLLREEDIHDRGVREKFWHALGGTMYKYEDFYWKIIKVIQPQRAKYYLLHKK